MGDNLGPNGVPSCRGAAARHTTKISLASASLWVHGGGRPIFPEGAGMRRRSGGIMGAFWLQLAFQTAAVATAAAAAAAADRSADADASACHFMINDAEADAFLFTGAADLHDDAL